LICNDPGYAPRRIPGRRSSGSTTSNQTYDALSNQLQLRDLAVVIVAADQVVMRAERLDAAALEECDPVRLPDGGQPVRDNRQR
jgi:hypothetical protein